MNPTQNPLEQLRDIHLPDTINSWILAPGWWTVIIALTVFSVYLARRWFVRRSRLKLLKPASIELKAIENLTPDNQAITRLSALLKRICLIYYPAKKVASLSGDDWITFLNQHADKPLFDDVSTKLFTQVAYQPEQILEKSQWLKLIRQSEQIINYIIRNEGQKNTRKIIHKKNQDKPLKMESSQ